MRVRVSRTALTWTQPPQGGGGSSAAYETTADKYVSSTGSNGNAGTSGSPYATIAYALSQISNGQTVGVLSNLTENLDWSAISSGGGSWATRKNVVAINAVRTISGTVSGTGASKYLRFKGLHWTSTSEATCQNATYLKFIACGFFGGPTTGNTSTHIAGSNQLYEGCWFGGAGGRYASLCYQCDSTLYRRCVVRTDTWGSPADDGNPNGGIQIYSSTNCARINCIAVDCLPQRSNNEFLAAFPVTSNVGAATGISDIGCIAVDNAAPGWQTEGASNITWTGTGLVSVRNTYGYIENLKNGNTGPLTINGSEFSSNTNDGLAGFGSGSVTASNVNTTGNGGSNFNGVTSGSGNTTSTLNMDTRLSAMKRIGVSETMYGETDWNTTQADDLFPFPYEDEIRSKFAALSTRGFCGGSYTLTSYLKRAA